MHIKDIFWRRTLNRTLKRIDPYWDGFIDIDKHKTSIANYLNELGFEVGKLTTIEIVRHICQKDPELYAANQMFGRLKITDMICQEYYLKYMIHQKQCTKSFPIIFNRIYEPIIKIKLITYLIYVDDATRDWILDIVHSDWAQSESEPTEEITDLLVILKLQVDDDQIFRF